MAEFISAKVDFAVRQRNGVCGTCHNAQVATLATLGVHYYYASYLAHLPEILWIVNVFVVKVENAFYHLF